MIEIARIDHIGMAVDDLDAVATRFEGLFGFEREGERDDDLLIARRVRFRVPGEQSVAWELLAPAGEGPLQQFIETPRGPGLHHVGFTVADPEAAAAAIDLHGIDPLHAPDRHFIEEDRGGEGLGFEILAAATTRSGATAPPSLEGETALGIRGLDHVCHAYRDRDELATWYRRTFGMLEAWRTLNGAREEYAGLVMEIPGQPLTWEIIMPAGDDSFVRRFLDERGPAVHHVAFQVADWERALAACEQGGVRILDTGEGETEGARWHEATLDPDDTGGALIRIAWEAEPGAWMRADKERSAAPIE